MFIDPEVPGARLALALATNVDDQGVERGELTFDTAIMERLHKRRYGVRITAKMELLRGRQASCLEDRRIANCHRTVDGPISDHEVDCIVDLLMREGTRHVDRG